MRGVWTIVMEMVHMPSGLDAALAGRYTFQAVLGAGATSTVYRARDEKHGRDVAIKVLRPELVGSVTRERFARETSIIARYFPGWAILDREIEEEG